MPLTAACSCSAIGALGQLLTEDGSSPRTFDNGSLRHEFIYESLGTERGLQSSQAINGTLNPLITTVRNKAYIPQGAIAVQASPIELGRWIPRIFGPPTGSEYISNNLPEFDVLVYRENGIFRYNDAVVAQAVLRGKASENAESIEFFDLIVQLIGKAELISPETGTAWPDPAPTLLTTAPYLPYAFWESNLELNSVEIEYESFTMVVNNMVDFRMNNRQVPSCIRSLGRTITMDIVAPFTCPALEEALDLNTTTGDALFTLAVEDLSLSTEFEFRHVRNHFKTPTIPGKTFVPIELRLEAYTDDPTKGLVLIDHDQTP